MFTGNRLNVRGLPVVTCNSTINPYNELLVCLKCKTRIFSSGIQTCIVKNGSSRNTIPNPKENSKYYSLNISLMFVTIIISNSFLKI